MAIQLATEVAIERASQAIETGTLVAFPTETVYGLGADALRIDAVAKIFEAKGRPQSDPLICHGADIEALLPLVKSLSPLARKLAERFWPGPLTLVLPKHLRVPDLVTAGHPTVAVRIPDHPVASDLLTAWNGPIAAPSANLFGRTSPTTAAHVEEQLGTVVDLILDGGPCRVGVESTILSIVNPTPLLLRPGGIALEALEACIGTPIEVPQPKTLQSHSPGRMEQHYAPKTPLYLTHQAYPETQGRIGRLSFTGTDCRDFAAVEILSPRGDLNEAAHRLFAALRRLDQLELDAIEAELVPERGLGRAIMDRLRRAAAHTAETN